MPAMGTTGNVDYRCWPSYSQQGCVLSVHSAREAAYICNSHSQCNSFTLTGQTTWTGECKLNLTPALPFFSLFFPPDLVSISVQSE